MAQRNMVETEESVEEAAKEARDERSLRRRFKIAHYTLAPARWMCMGVCRVLGLSFDLWMHRRDSPSMIESMEHTHQVQMDNIIQAFAFLLGAVKENERGEYVLPESDVVGAARFSSTLVLTSLSDEGKKNLAAMIERRNARNEAKKESGENDGTQV